MLLYLAAATTIFATFLYHIFQTTISDTANPLASLAVSYCTALAISLALLICLPDKAGLEESFKQLNWASFATGFAIVGIEIGYVLAYRQGWSISLGPVATNASAAIFLAFFELIVLKKGLETTNLIGVFLCTVGMIFTTKH